MYRKICKAKLHDDGRVDVQYLKYHGDDDDTEPDVITLEGKHRAHDDLLNAFDTLRIHMATITEQKEFTEMEDNVNLLDIFRVSGVSWGGSEPNQGVTITGIRKLRGSKVLNINTPFTKLDPDKSDYLYRDSLSMSLDTLESELDQYIQGTKYAPSRQLDLFDDASADDIMAAEHGEDEAAAPQEKTRKKRGKQVTLPAEDPESEAVGVQ